MPSWRAAPLRRARIMELPIHNELIALVDKRKYDAVQGMLKDASVVQRIIAESDGEVLRVLAKNGTKRSWDMIKTLIDHGDSKRVLVKTCAYNGNIRFLEKLCQEKWHDYEGSWDDMIVNAAESSQLCVMRWLEMDLGYVGKRHQSDRAFTLETAISFSITNDDVEIFEHLWGLCQGDNMTNDWKSTVCYEAATEFAPYILDYLVTKVGREMVLQEVEDALCLDWFEHHHAAEAWLKKVSNVHVETNIKNAMSLIDDVRDQIPEGHYLQISNLLLRAYRQ